MMGGNECLGAEITYWDIFKNAFSGKEISTNIISGEIAGLKNPALYLTYIQR